MPVELNNVYGHFDSLNKVSAVQSTLPPEDADVRRILLKVYMSKASGPDNIPGLALKHVSICWLM